MCFRVLQKELRQACAEILLASLAYSSANPCSACKNVIEASKSPANVQPEMIDVRALWLAKLEAHVEALRTSLLIFLIGAWTIMPRL
jgi:hypothetical protein